MRKTRKDIYIKKTSGEIEPFDSWKLKNSLIKAGASILVADEIVSSIISNLRTGTSTTEIYKNAFALLKRKAIRPAFRYSVKRSLTNLGPTGFPFEKYIAKIFSAKGFNTAVNQTLKGRCVDHEVDVVAWDNDHLVLCEVKFHNELGMKSDTKVALYVKSRFDDLKGGTFRYGGVDKKMTDGILVTNTKFTDNAVRYSSCAGINLISWGYPTKGNLHDLVEETKVHPITCLSSLSVSDKKAALEQGIVTTSDILSHPRSLANVGISIDKIDRALEEIKMIHES